MKKVIVAGVILLAFFRSLLRVVLLECARNISTS